jgi:hypothetical protein
MYAKGWLDRKWLYYHVGCEADLAPPFALLDVGAHPTFPVCCHICDRHIFSIDDTYHSTAYVWRSAP